MSDQVRRLTLVLETEDLGAIRACIDAAERIMERLPRYRLEITLEEEMDEWRR